MGEYLGLLPGALRRQRDLRRLLSCDRLGNLASLWLALGCIPPVSCLGLQEFEKGLWASWTEKDGSTLKSCPGIVAGVS